MRGENKTIKRLGLTAAGLATGVLLGAANLSAAQESAPATAPAAPPASASATQAAEQETARMAADLVVRAAGALVRNDFGAAMDLSKAAIALDSKFAPAHLHYGLACQKSYAVGGAKDAAMRQTAIKAFQEFLKLDAQSVDAPSVRERLKQLAASETPAAPVLPSAVPATVPVAVKPTPVPTPKPGEIWVFWNGKRLTLGAGVQKSGDNVRLPAVELFAALGARYQYFASSLTAHVTFNTAKTSTIIGSMWANLSDGSGAKLDLPADMTGNRVMVPLRFVALALGAKATYDAKKQSVFIVTAGGESEAAPPVPVSPIPASPNNGPQAIPISTNAVASPAIARPLPPKPIETALPVIEPTIIAPAPIPVAAPAVPVAVPWMPRYRLTHTKAVRAAAYSHDGRLLATASWRTTQNGATAGEVKLWDTSSGSGVRALAGHWASVNALAFAPNDQLLASGSQDKTVLLWNVRDGSSAGALTGATHEQPIIAVRFSPDGKTLVSADSGGALLFWNVATRKLSRMMSLEGHTKSIRAVDFSWATGQIVTGSEDQSVRLWDLKTGEARGTVIEGKGYVTAVAFSPDGARLASANYKAVWLSDLSLKTAARSLSENNGVVKTLSFSSDGKLLASGGEGGGVVLWNTETDERRPLVQPAEVGALCFRPAASELVCGDINGKVVVWR